MEEKDKEINDIITIDGYEISCDVSKFSSDELVNAVYFKEPKSIKYDFITIDGFNYSKMWCNNKELLFNSFVKNNGKLMGYDDREYKCVDYKQVNDKVGVLTFQDIETGEEYFSYI